MASASSWLGDLRWVFFFFGILLLALFYVNMDSIFGDIMLSFALAAFLFSLIAFFIYIFNKIQEH